ncbi:MAG: hypothetical protein ABSH16_14565, partial [Sedimentisphaerales bacterium]
MIEVAAKELPEAVVSQAIETGHQTVKVICEMIEELRQKAGVEKETPEIVPIDEHLCSKIRAQIGSELQNAKLIQAKQQRRTAASDLREKLIEQYCGSQTESAGQEKPEEAMVKRIFDKIEGEIIRELALKGKR